MTIEKYGLLKYSSTNIGDEVQSLAAMRFLPRVDYFIHREQTNRFKSEHKTKLIMNGWWMWRPKHLPPSADIEPLLISMHITRRVRDKFLSKRTKKYLIEHGPVGCRDYDTAEWLNNNDVPAYFSGCLTLTLQKNPKIKKKDYIIAVDVSEEIENEIRKRTRRPVYNISRMISVAFTQEERYQIAKILLYLYQSAHCVITSRLHVAMPSIALETPVLLLDLNDNILNKDGRYTGLKDLCNVVKENDFLKNEKSYSIDNPPKNPDKYLEIRSKLVEACSRFTGYNNEESIIDDTMIPELELIKLMKFNYSKILKTVWWIKSKDLFKAAFQKAILGKTRNDVL